MKFTYSLIILDVQMPGMDGFEVADAISGFSKARDIPIIFLSAVNTDKKFITKGYTSGGVDYVTKPVDPDIFMLKVKTLHKLYEQNRELKEVRASLLEEVGIRKAAEEQLSRRVSELHSILEAIPQIAFALTADGDIEYVNDHWYYYSASSTVLPDFHADDQCTRQKWNDVIRTAAMLESEVRIKHLETGLFRYHLLRMIPVKNRDRVLMWVGTFTDIDEQKSANVVLETKVAARTLELSLKNKELEASNYELQQFASVASHDLKEPLRKIQLCSSILNESDCALQSETKLNISRIINSASRMSILINDLIDHSRLSMQTFFENVDLNNIVAEVLTDLELSIHDKKAVITCDQLPVLESIPGQMRQVFQNLISNSLKFAQQGIAPVIDIRAEFIAAGDIDAAADPSGHYTRITIRDNGIGFDEQYLDKVFTIFQRLNPKDAYEGTGIGLAIVKKIIEKHGGSITGKSSEGQGATFMMTLPLHQSLNNHHNNDHQISNDQ